MTEMPANPQNTTPVATSPAPAATTPTPTPTTTIPAKGAPCPPGCSCVKGGLPMPKEVTTFLLLLAVIGLVIVGILFIDAKRNMAELERQAVAPSAPELAEDLPIYPMPVIRGYLEQITLPQPQRSGGKALNTTLQERRTRRAFSDQTVSMAELSQMLWSAQGVTDTESGKRIAPSAREAYPYTVYVVVRSVSGLEPGLYEYLPQTHSLGKMPLADAGQALNEAGVQEGAQQAPVVFILSASLAKSAEKMGANAVNSTMLEGGHIGQNLYLQAESSNLALVVMAGFSPPQVREALELDPGETPVYVIPFGHRGVEAVEE